LIFDPGNCRKIGTAGTTLYTGVKKRFATSRTKTSELVPNLIYQTISGLAVVFRFHHLTIVGRPAILTIGLLSEDFTREGSAAQIASFSRSSTGCESAVLRQDHRGLFGIIREG
jgi:hypothetical protein